MDGTTFHGASYFYLVPVVIFLPLILFALWNFGLKDIFRRSDKEVRARRLDQIRREKDAKRRLEKSGGLAIRPVTEPPRTVLSWIGRAVAYGAYACVLAVFSNWPPYAYHDPHAAQVKLSLSVPGARKEACHKRSREELMKLPPNMRAPMQCSRERLPVAVSLAIDGQTLYAASQAPAGLSGDGSSSFYEKFAVPAGTHRIAVRLSFDGGASYSHTLEESVVLAPTQVLVVGYGGTDKALFLQ